MARHRSGSVHWNELWVKEPEATLKFYAKVFSSAPQQTSLDVSMHDAVGLLLGVADGDLPSLQKVTIVSSVRVN